MGVYCQWIFLHCTFLMYMIFHKDEENFIRNFSDYQAPVFKKITTVRLVLPFGLSSFMFTIAVLF